jgi:hypothetical protein
MPRSPDNLPLDQIADRVETIVNGLADQQAMADDSWRSEFDELMATLRSIGMLGGWTQESLATMLWEKITPAITFNQANNVSRLILDVSESPQKAS